ncbi:unnamed protein product [Ectocarpus fasciculatus]
MPVGPRCSLDLAHEVAHKRPIVDGWRQSRRRHQQKRASKPSKRGLVHLFVFRQAPFPGLSTCTPGPVTNALGHTPPAPYVATASPPPPRPANQALACKC